MQPRRSKMVMSRSRRSSYCFPAESRSEGSRNESSFSKDSELGLHSLRRLGTELPPLQLYFLSNLVRCKTTFLGRESHPDQSGRKSGCCASFDTMSQSTRTGVLSDASEAPKCDTAL